ncbi:hypothetical protein STSP2_01326 [Anaerohalosphaera lusitana]|uniref:Uncharacterized protein n=1 Tax=Anaerohalosphaera lusitana TaxID=1936003 RepID=A0A1U9NJS2_9BACT|nr:hypothetical protein STSP2_01326 [Anaerohalosphaera lusitana]
MLQKNNTFFEIVIIGHKSLTYKAIHPYVVGVVHNFIAWVTYDTRNSPPKH